MAEGRNNPSTDGIANIVRRLVGAIGNLPSNLPNESGSATSSGTSVVPSYSDAQHELLDRFRISRTSTTSVSGSGRVLPRARSSGRFVPYTKGKGKGKSEREIVIKDVCLMPYPEWTKVPRRAVKETLVRQGLYIDAWSMDKSWSEETLRTEIRSSFGDRLEGGNDFEFVKAIGNTVTKVTLPRGQEASARVIKHVAGTGPIYVRALTKIDLSELKIDSDSEEESDFQVTIAQYLAEERDINGNTSGSERMEERDTIGNTSGSERVEERNTIGFEGTSVQPEVEELPSTSVGVGRNVIVPQPVAVNDRNNEFDEFAGLSVPPDEALQLFQSQMVDSSRIQPININRNVKQEREMLRVYKANIHLQRKPVVYFYSFDDDDSEDGSDVGGLTREFFQIVHDTILSGIHPPFPCFEGAKDHLLPIHSQELQGMGIFRLIGKAIAHSILHGGPPFEGLATPVKKYLLTSSIEEAADTISIDDCPYLDVVELLKSIQDAEEDEIKDLNVNASISEQLFLSGCSMSFLNVHNKHLAVSQILKHNVLLRRLKELDDIIEGLNSINVQKFLSVNPLVAEIVFPTVEQAEVSFTFLKDVIRVADALDDEQQKAYNFFLQYLQQRCERTETGGTNIKDVLQFITGKTEMPSLLRVTFHSERSKTLPGPDTCLCSVRLPYSHATLEEFARAFDVTVSIQGVGYGHV